MSVLHPLALAFIFHFCKAIQFIKSKERIMKISAYLTFNGDCREAMNFYKDCIGGELTIQTIGDSPLADKMPPQMKEYILHATLIKGNLVLMGSDMAAEKGLVNGNKVSMVLDCDQEEEVRNCYAKLSAGGAATHPLEISFWGALFGDLEDKYGNHWLLNFEKKTVSH
jgi:PhnB protein